MQTDEKKTTTDGDKRMPDRDESTQDMNSTMMGGTSAMKQGGRQQCVAGETWMTGHVTEMKKEKEEIMRGSGRDLQGKVKYLQ